MRIIILGTGPVSITLTEELSRRGHAITVIDDCRESLDKLQQRLDISTVFGRPSYPDALSEAGADDTDVLLAVSDTDELNMVSCQAAHSLFSIKLKIARIKSPHYFIRKELFGKLHMPIDVFINPEVVIAKLIKGLIKVPHCTYASELSNPDFTLIGLHIGKDNKLIGHIIASHAIKLKNMQIPVLALYRDKQLMVQFKNRHIRVDDELYLLIATSQLDSLLPQLYADLPEVKHILLAGGGHVGLETARILSEEYQVKVIERQYGRCQYLSEQLDEVTVLHGDATDRELIEQEHIEHCDVYCALTNDDEDNILSSLQARYLGAKRIISLVNRTNYVDVLEHDHFHITVSPQQQTIYAILSHLTFPGVKKVHGLGGRGAELIEVRIAAWMSKTVIDKKVTELTAHRGAQCLVIIREGCCMVDHIGKHRCQANDLLIFLAEDQAAREYLAEVFAKPD